MTFRFTEHRGAYSNHFILLLASFRIGHVELLVQVKQGQMEVFHTDDFEPNYDNTVLIPRTVVDDLNKQVRNSFSVHIEGVRSKSRARR